MRLRTPHHSLAPPVPDDSLRNLCTRPVEAVERTRRHVPIKLGSVIGNLRLESVEHFFRKTTGVRGRLDHDRRDRGDENGLGGPTLSMAREIMHNLTATGRMTNVHGVLEVQMLR